MAKDNREDLTKVVKVDGGIEGVDFYSCNEKDICCSDQCSRLRQNEAVEYKPIRASELTVTIDADVDEAVAGFKRLQRELRETTKAVRELESAYKDLHDAEDKV